MSQTVTRFSRDVPPAHIPAQIPAQRLDWVDFAKGLCIVLVVGMWVDRSLQGQSGWLSILVSFSQPFRMPDFFLLSGLFMAEVIDRPWRRFLDTKVVHYLYFLVLWSALIVPATWLGVNHRPQDAADALRNLAVHTFWKPEGSLWFLLMLPLFWVLSRCLARGWLVVLPLAALASMASLQTHWYPLDWWAKYFVFFYAGAVLGPEIREVAAWTAQQPARAAALLCAWVLANAVFTQSDWAHAQPFLFLASALGALAVVMLSSLTAAAQRALGGGRSLLHTVLAGLRHLGQQSLVVFLGYYLPMMGLVRLQRRLWPDLAPGWVATLVWAGSVSCAWGLWRLLGRTRWGRWLYQRPAWVRWPSSGHSREDAKTVAVSL